MTGRELEALRRGLGLSISDLARLSGIAASRLRRAELNEVRLTEPEADSLRRLPEEMEAVR